MYEELNGVKLKYWFFFKCIVKIVWEILFIIRVVISLMFVIGGL